MIDPVSRELECVVVQVGHLAQLAPPRVNIELDAFLGGQRVSRAIGRIGGVIGKTVHPDEMTVVLFDQQVLWHGQRAGNSRVRYEHGIVGQDIFARSAAPVLEQQPGQLRQLGFEREPLALSAGDRDVNTSAFIERTIQSNVGHLGGGGSKAGLHLNVPKLQSPPISEFTDAVGGQRIVGCVTVMGIPETGTVRSLKPSVKFPQLEATSHIDHSFGARDPAGLVGRGEAQSVAVVGQYGRIEKPRYSVNDGLRTAIDLGEGAATGSCDGEGVEIQVAVINGPDNVDGVRDQIRFGGDVVATTGAPTSTCSTTFKSTLY